MYEALAKTRPSPSSFEKKKNWRNKRGLFSSAEISIVCRHISCNLLCHE
jgi:hypothetical protein